LTEAYAVIPSAVARELEGLPLLLPLRSHLEPLAPVSAVAVVVFVPSLPSFALVVVLSSD